MLTFSHPRIVKETPSKVITDDHSSRADTNAITPNFNNLISTQCSGNLPFNERRLIIGIAVVSNIANTVTAIIDSFGDFDGLRRNNSINGDIPSVRNWA